MTDRLTYTTLEQCHKEHAEIDGLLVDLLRSVVERRDPHTDIGDMCRHLREHLTHHFQDEELHGLFSLAVNSNGEYAAECHELQEQHAEFLRELDLIEGATRCTQPTVAWWEDLEGRIHAFAASLSRHEEQECKLAQTVCHA